MVGPDNDKEETNQREVAGGRANNRKVNSNLSNFW